MSQDKNPQWKSLIPDDSWTSIVNKAHPDSAYNWWGFGTLYLSASSPGNGRLIDTLPYTFPFRNAPYDAGFPAVGPPTETDENGNIYCVENQLWIKTPVDSVFRPTNIPRFNWGFPAPPTDTTRMA